MTDLKSMTNEELIFDFLRQYEKEYSENSAEAELSFRLEEGERAKKEVLELQSKVYETIGWAHAFLCSSVDSGLDIREIEVPVMLEKAKTQLELKNK